MNRYQIYFHLDDECLTSHHKVIVKADNEEAALEEAKSKFGSVPFGHSTIKL